MNEQLPPAQNEAPKQEPTSWQKEPEILKLLKKELWHERETI